MRQEMESYRKLNLTLQKQLADMVSSTPSSFIDTPKMQPQLMELCNPMKPTKEGVSKNI